MPLTTLEPRTVLVEDLHPQPSDHLGVTRIVPRLGETGTTQDIIDLLARAH